VEWALLEVVFGVTQVSQIADGECWVGHRLGGRSVIMHERCSTDCEI
jgi:hypothetical protein